MFRQMVAKDSEYEPVAFKIPKRHRHNKTMIEPLQRLPSGFVTTKMNLVQNTFDQAQILRNEHARQSSFKAEALSRHQSNFRMPLR